MCHFSYRIPCKRERRHEKTLEDEITYGERGHVEENQGAQLRCPAELSDKWSCVSDPAGILWSRRAAKSRQRIVTLFNKSTIS